MATQDEVEQLQKILQEAHPHDSIKEIDRASMGQGAVLWYLAKAEGPVTSGQIAKALHGSTARMAVLLKKLEVKGYIHRKPGIEDARTIVVSLSESGYKKIEEGKRETYHATETLIDEIGFERMLEFANTALEIHYVMKRLQLKNPPQFE